VGKVQSLPSLNDASAILEIIDEAFRNCDEFVLQDAQAKLQAVTEESKIDQKTDLMRIRDAGRPGCCVAIVLIAGEYIFAANVG